MTGLERCYFPRDKNEIAVLKRNVTDKKLLSNCPPQFSLITKHLRTLSTLQWKVSTVLFSDYHKRPGYQLIFEVLHVSVLPFALTIFQQIMDKYNIRPSDPFDWEVRRGPLARFIVPCRSSNILTSLFHPVVTSFRLQFPRIQVPLSQPKETRRAWN